MSKPRLIAMLTVHNERHNLPRWLENVRPHVDGIVALDDRSTDGSGDYLCRDDHVLEVQRIEPTPSGSWNEPLAHRLLVELASKHGADWVLGVDADERLERHFRSRADRWIAWARRCRLRALDVKVHDLWDSPITYRVDGIWARKRKSVLFSTRGRLRFDPSELHGAWAPHKPRYRLIYKAHPLADLIVYHCKMIDPENRVRRRDTYKALDPESRWSPAGYDYLTDTTGLRLKELPEGRDYVPLEPRF